MIIPQKIQAKLVDKQDFSSRFGLYRFELVSPANLEKQAGQYLMLEVGAGQKRAYSFCDRPDLDSSFELLVDHEPDGVGVNYLRHLQFGQTITGVAPLGSLTVKPELAGQPLILIATGTGISPLKSIITDQLQLKKSPATVILIWGMRYDDDLFWRDDFEALARDFAHFQFVPVVSRPSDLWTGETGRVTDYLARQDFSPGTTFFVCGNQEMLTQVQQILLAKNIPPTAILSEKFTSNNKP